MDSFLFGCDLDLIEECRFSQDIFEFVLNLRACVRVCVRACVCVCIYACIMYMNMYIYIQNTHTHTHNT